MSQNVIIRTKKTKIVIAGGEFVGLTAARYFDQVRGGDTCAVAPADVAEDVENLSWGGATAGVHLRLRIEIRLDCPFDDTSRFLPTTIDRYGSLSCGPLKIPCE
jgi:hypothetical protein